MNLGVSTLKDSSKQRVGYSISPNKINEKRVIHVLATLQLIFKFILTISAALGIVFMILCTAFVVVSVIRGDIKIGMVKDETEKQNK